MIEIVGFEQNVVILVVVTVSNLTTINDAIIRYMNVEYSIDIYLIDFKDQFSATNLPTAVLNLLATMGKKKALRV